MSSHHTEMETNLRALMENITDAILVLDPQGKILYANPMAHTLLGKPGQELIGLDFGHPIINGTPTEIDLPNYPESPGTGELNCAPTTWHGEDAWIISIRDVTARKQTERSLRDSQKNLQLYNQIANIFLTSPEVEGYTEVLQFILENVQSPLGLLGYIDEQGNWCCPGISPGLFLQEPPLQDNMLVISPEDWCDIWGQAMQEKRTIYTNQPIQLPYETSPLTRALNVPLLMKDELVGNLLVLNKPTDYTRAEQTHLEGLAHWLAPIFYARQQRDRERREKERLQEQLQQSQKLESIGRLAGGVAHDFNNMLSVILGYGEEILQQLHEEDPLWKDIQEIVDAGERSARLTQQLLAFSRKQPMQPMTFLLNQQLQDMKKMLHRLIGEDISIQMELAEDLACIKADPHQIEQVILNLAINARDAMPEGGELLIETTNIELDEAYASRHQNVLPGEYVMLAVTDTGHGMDQETQSMIFEPFFTTKEHGYGTGLGLSTVYGIIKQSGGHIWVYSEPGEGTTFKMYFPAIQAEPERAETSQEISSAHQPNAHILIVEDEEAVRELIYKFLTRRGYRVSTAANAGEALLMVEAGLHPDLLLTDVVMPNMSGKALADRLKKVYPDLKVLYMSGYTDNAIVHRGILPRETPFLQKPFNPRDLTKKIQELLQQEERDDRPR